MPAASLRKDRPPPCSPIGRSSGPTLESPMLEVRDISAVYGKHRALDGVSLDVGRGEIVVILGANGAGKTTLLKVIAGLVPAADRARITMNGRQLAGISVHHIVEAGLALVPEGRGIFGELTVRENLLLGAFPARARRSEAATLDMVLDLFPRLRERLQQVVRTMSGGEQQMVAVGRATICCSPPLMVRTTCCSRSRNRGKRSRTMSSVAASLRRARAGKAPSRRFSRTGSSPKIPRPSGTSARPASTMCLTEMPASWRPFIVMRAL